MSILQLILESGDLGEYGDFGESNRYIQVTRVSNGNGGLSDLKLWGNWSLYTVQILILQGGCASVQGYAPVQRPISPQFLTKDIRQTPVN